MRPISTPGEGQTLTLIWAVYKGVSLYERHNYGRLRSKNEKTPEIL